MKGHMNDTQRYEQVCSICKGNEFGLGPGGRLSAYGKYPFCNSCGSLERHRAIRSVWESIQKVWPLHKSKTLQISPDFAVDRGWFDSYEVSVYGKSNSIDIHNINRPDKSYDIILCNHVLEHVADPSLALRELMRITSDKGFLQISVPDPFRLERTVDWGYPKEEDHGHYRLYGPDIIKLFRETLKDHYLLTVVGIDHTTGSEEVMFFISQSYDLRFLYPTLQAKHFQKLSKESVMPNLPSLIHNIQKPNFNGICALRVYFSPDYTITNPYQKLLADSLPTPIISGPGTIEDALRAQCKFTTDKIVYHQHWIQGILGNGGTIEEVKKSILNYTQKILEFRRNGGKVLWTIHNIVSHEAVFPQEETDIYRFLLKTADLIHIHSEESKKIIEKLYPIPSEKIIIAPHGNYAGVYADSINQTSAREILQLPLTAKIFLFFGQVRSYKGIDDLIQTFIRVFSNSFDNYLVIAGDPGLLLETEKQKLSTIHPRIIFFWGHVPDESIQLFFKASDVVVLPYRRILTSGSAMLAFTFGRPIICPKLGTLKDLVSEEINGWTYDPREEEALETALHKVGEISRANLSQMGVNAKLRAENFNWEVSGRILGRHLVSLFWGKLSLVSTFDNHECIVSQAKKNNKGKSRTAAIILHFGYLEDTIRCLNSLLNQSNAACDIFLVSNDLNSDAYVFFVENFSQVTILQSPNNLGYAGGNNLILSLLKNEGYDFFWILNPDLIPAENALQLFEHAADKYKETSIFGPLIYFGDRPDTIWYGGGEIDISDGLEVKHSYHGVKQDFADDTPWSTSYVTGACLFFRSELLTSNGLLPEEFFLYFEETLWCWNASQNGHKLLVVPNIKTWHFKRSENNGVPTLTYIYYFSRNLLIMCKKLSPSGIDRTLQRLRSTFDLWMQRAEQESPSEIKRYRLVFARAIEDGLALRYGKVDLD